MNKFSRKKTVLVLVFLVFMWGLNWPLTKLALNDSPPIIFSGLRTLLAGCILLAFVLRNYSLLRFKETWSVYIISTILNVILFYGLQTIGIEYLPAGVFSAIIYVQPVLLGIFSWIWLGEAMYGIKIFGLVLGFVGVTVISLDGLGSNISIIGTLLALGSAIAWGLGTVYIKKIGHKVDSIWLVTVQFIIGGIILTCIGTGVERWSAINWSIGFISNLLFISIFVIALGWLAYFALMRSGEVSKVGVYTFLIPLIAIASSTFILKESITSGLLMGLVFIVVSICCVNLTPKSVRNKHNKIVMRRGGDDNSINNLVKRQK
jgi:drug/metabolite transporter (DMT)-like permease